MATPCLNSTMQLRDLHIREDTAKYLINIHNPNSNYYDPKSHSIREDPFPDADPNEKFYAGDNQYRMSGQALEFKQISIHAWEAFEKGQDIHVQAAPSQAELLFKNFKIIKEKLKSQTKDAILEKYGNAACNGHAKLTNGVLNGHSPPLKEHSGNGLKSSNGSSNGVYTNGNGSC